jgi:hypothetical protein
LPKLASLCSYGDDIVVKLFRMLVLLAAAAVAFPTFAADELMKAAQARFNPIPLTPPTLSGAQIDCHFYVLGTIRSQS